MRHVAWLVLAACGRLEFAERAPARVDVPASVAACIDPKQPDPAACESFNGGGQLVVDEMDSTTHDPWNSYVRFELPDSLRGRHVAAVTLEVTATDDARAPGTSTGTVWRVAPFSLADLGVAAPALLDAAPLAGSQGAVVQDQVIDWPLPVSVIVPRAPVCLALLGDAVDGVNYWNLDGPAPPRLMIDIE